MKAGLEFYKYSGTGNDFVIIDNRKKVLKNIFKFAIKVCDRKNGVGGDGLLLIENSKVADFKMRIINSDGSEAEMCGNGARCIAHFAFFQKIAPKDMNIETRAGIIDAHVKGAYVKVKLPKPHSFRQGIRIKYKDKDYELFSISTGVPHAVIFVDNLENIPVEELGRYIRYHDKFKPAGTNVNFVKIINEKEIAIRTYERGVEAETLSCGTGSAASAIISSFVRNMQEPIIVRTRGGDKLKVYLSPLYLEGKVMQIFKGEFLI
jgi:diaminopimelate epimerase